MPALLLDTSTDYAIVGICDKNGAVISSRIQTHDRQLSVKLYGMIEDVLLEAKLSRDQIEAFSVGLGPGSFTGVRVAVTTMRTLAQVMSKPLYAFGTLEAIAATAVLNNPELNDSPILAMLPSRRDEVYAEIFHSGMVVMDSEAASYTRAKLLFDEMNSNCVAVGPDSLLHALFPDMDKSRLIAVEHPSVESMAHLTKLAIAKDDIRNPMSLDPMYVAPPAVSQHKQLR